MSPSVFSAYQKAVADGNAKLVRQLEDDVVKMSKPLIGSCIKRFQRCGNYGDLAQAGRIGVLRALRKFVPNKGAWASYAKQWVLSEMTRGVVLFGDVVQIGSVYDEGLTLEARKKEQSISALEGREATAEELGVTEQALETMRWRREGAGKDASGLIDATELDEDCPGKRPAMPEELYSPAQENVFTKTFLKALGELTALEQTVLLAYTIQEKLHREIADEVGLKEEVVRLTFLRAKEKMRAALSEAEIA